MKELQLPDAYIVHLPKTLNVEELIRQHPLKVKSLESKPERVIEYIKLILGQITEQFKQNKDYKISSYINIPSTILKGIWSDYSIILEWAYNADIIDTDEEYIPGIKAYGYRFTRKYSLRNLKKEYIISNSIVKKLEKIHLEVAAIEKYPHLAKSLETLEIDVEAAYKTLRELEDGKTKYDRRTAMVDNIKAKKYYFKLDKVGRLHTSVCSLKREVRKHLSAKGENLVNVDIKNSQPFFSTILLNPDLCDEYEIENYLKEYNYQFNINDKYYQQLIHMCRKNAQNLDTYVYKVLDGKLYEHIMEVGNIESREEAKEIVFKVFFNPPNYPTKERKLFKSVYPEVIDIFDLINIGYIKTRKRGRKKDEQSSSLALTLQRIESDIMLNNVVEDVLMEFGEIPIYTIHDSLLVPESVAEKVKQCMEDTIETIVGYRPKIEIE